ncbi:hypothetical protein [Mycobacterium sp.]
MTNRTAVVVGGASGIGEVLDLNGGAKMKRHLDLMSHAITFAAQ